MSSWMFATFIVLLRAVTQCHSECEVLVNDPWPTPSLFVPQGSTVRMNCRADSTSPSLSVWSIDLASDPSVFQFRFDTEGQILNADGVYQLPKIETSGNSTTLGLLINNTAKNNGTGILCRRGTLSLESTLFVLEPAQFKFEVFEQERKSVNLIWSQESSSMVDTLWNFSLTINYGSNRQVISLNESYFYFTAPEGAPSCEVYNFSVTATYVGATYTGAGCSAPSPMLSRMLPSLPNIDEVETTLSYLLTKEPKGDLVLQVLFEPPTDHCSTHIYTLVVILNESVLYQQLFLPTESTMVANVTSDNLRDNAALNFRVQVRNSLSGTLEETHIITIYTTDVQDITVAVISEHSAPGMVLVQCDFIPGSDAQGCMVVLVGQSDNTTVNLTRDGTLLTACGVKSLPTTTSIDVFGFDIESDGTIGTIQVPGIVTTVVSSTEFDTLCQLKETNTLPLLSTRLMILVSSLAGAVLAMVLLIVVSATIICQYSRKSSAIFQPHQSPAAVNSYVTNHDDVDNQQQDNVPYYDQPERIINSSSNESEYSRTSHTLQVSPTLSSGSESTTYSRLQDSQDLLHEMLPLATEHTYHLLENNRPPYGVKDETYFCADGRPDAQPPDPPPIYHTIQCDERPVEEQLYAQVPSSPLHLQSANDQPQEIGPIYQELAMSTNTGPITAQTSPTTVGMTTVV